MKLPEKESVQHGTREINVAIYDHPFPDPFSSFQAHWHPEYEIEYVYKGPVTYILNGVCHTLVDGEALFVNKDMIHSCAVPPDQCGRYASIVFGEQFVFSSFNDSLYESFVLPLYDNHRLFPAHISTKNDGMEEIVHHIEGLLRCYFEKAYAYEIGIRSHLLGIFHVAMQHDIFVKADYREKAPTSIVRNALHFIQQNYMLPLSVQEVASNAHISSEYFSRIFKNAIGKRPLDYINAYRIDQSKYFLSQTNDAISTIALNCGFGDINYFSRCFKKTQGITPSEYRKKYYDSPDSTISKKDPLA